MENAHEAIIDEEKFKFAQNMRTLRREQYCKHGFQSKYLLTGMLICGVCGGKYYRNHVKKYAYYCCYSRTKKIAAMIKNPNCRNKTWRAAELESIIDGRIRELLASPQAIKELAKVNRPKPISVDNSDVEKRIKEIDKQISKFMELYQLDKIPPNILGDNINKLYNEKTALQETMTKNEEPENYSFNFIETLLADAAQIWDFADDPQKRRILQGLIKRIVLTGDEVKIKWNF